MNCIVRTLKKSFAIVDHVHCYLPSLVVDGPPSSCSLFTDGQLLAGMQEQIYFGLPVHPCGDESVR